MKLGATDSIKFKKLKKRLNLTHWQAVGLLESIWMFVSRNAPQGDVGRHSNEDIAASIEWSGDENELIRTLVDCNWFDVSEDCRFVIHDWEEHMPNWLRGNLAKHRKPVKTGISAKQLTLEQLETHVAKQPPVQSSTQQQKQPAAKR